MAGSRADQASPGSGRRWHRDSRRYRGAMLRAGRRAYLWVKAVHVIAVIAWMAGMFYLPRLFIYHCEAPKGSAAVRDLQGDGAAAAAHHHEPGDGRCLGLGLWLAWKGGWSSDAAGFTPSWRW